MMKQEIKTKFVNYMPDILEDNILYVAEEFNTAFHNCACGCGELTVTPLDKDNWKLTMNGDKATLKPSIGNFNIPCNSHYFIRDGKIIML